MSGWLAVGVCAYALYLLLLYVQQRSMMFPGVGMRFTPMTELSLPANARPVVLPASFGEVQALWLQGTGTADRSAAALYLHGNAESVGQNLAGLNALAQRGLHVLLVEYPGYAGAAGTPTRAALSEATRLAFDHLAAHPQVDARRIVAIGRSIGSGPATDLSRERSLAALILLSPFADLDSFAHSVGAPAMLIRDRFDNLAALRSFTGPVLLVHGRRDAIIPPSHSRRLTEVAPRASLRELDCGHNDCPFFERAGLQLLETFLHEQALLGVHD